MGEARAGPRSDWDLGPSTALDPLRGSPQHWNSWVATWFLRFSDSLCASPAKDNDSSDVDSRGGSPEPPALTVPKEHRAKTHVQKAEFKAGRGGGRLIPRPYTPVHTRVWATATRPNTRNHLNRHELWSRAGLGPSSASSPTACHHHPRGGQKKGHSRRGLGPSCARIPVLSVLFSMDGALSANRWASLSLRFPACTKGTMTTPSVALASLPGPHPRACE